MKVMAMVSIVIAGQACAEGRMFLLMTLLLVFLIAGLRTKERVSSASGET